MDSRAGRFDEDNPPIRIVDGQEKKVFAVRMCTGIVYYDLDATMHLDVVVNLDLDVDQVVDGGWIHQGKWDPGKSERYSSKDPDEVRRINEECDQHHKYGSN